MEDLAINSLDWNIKLILDIFSILQGNFNSFINVAYLAQQLMNSTNRMESVTDAWLLSIC